MKIFYNLLLMATIALFFACSTLRPDLRLKNNEISPELASAIESFFDLISGFDEYKTADFSDYFFLGRFYQVDGKSFFSITFTGSFPFGFYFEDQFYLYDKNLMYYYRFKDTNVILMDMDKFDLNPLVKKRSRRNSIVNRVKRYYIKNTKYHLRIKSPHYVVLTYEIDTSVQPYKLIMTNSMRFTPYSSEKILEDDIIIEQN